MNKPAHSSLAGVVALAFALTPSVGSTAVVGFLGNFDVINDTGSTAHGFEIELEGLHSSDISDTFGGPGRGFPTGRGFDPSTSVQRYGSPTITDYANGAVFGARVTSSHPETTAGQVAGLVTMLSPRATTLALAPWAIPPRPLTAGCSKPRPPVY